MSTSCSRGRGLSQGLWSCLVVSTLAGCGILLYLSYIYRGDVGVTCVSCDKNSNIHSEKLTQEDCQHLCSSKECVLAAHSLLENMNPNIDPCEDFYSFSCGNWMQKFSKNDNFSVIDGMEMRLKVTLKNILESLQGPPGSESEKLKMVYDSCISDRASESRAIRSVKEFLDRFGIGGWPNLTTEFEFTESSLERTLGRLAAFNEFAFVVFNPTKRETDEDPNHLFNLIVGSAYPLMRDESESGIYESMILRVLRYFGIPDGRANRTWEDFKKVDESVLKLYVESSHTASEDHESEEEDLTYLNCTLQMSNNTGSLCKILRHFIEYTDTGNRFSKDDAFVSMAHYVENIHSLVKSFTNREVANYLALRFIMAHLDVLNIQFRVALLGHPDAYSLHTAYKIFASKWEQCVWWISNFMPFALGQEYVARELSTGQLQEMHEIVRIYLEEAEDYISKQKWIEEEKRKILKTATGNMVNSMEYFVKVLQNGSKLNLLLEGFYPTHQSFLQNVMEYRRNTLRFYLLNFKAMETEEFPSDPFAVNAYHSYGRIDLRFGMFLPPVYQHGLPKLLNLASMGTTIAHEIGHEIVLFFGDPENDLDEETRNNYMAKKKCLVEEYFRFDVPKIGRKVKGNQTFYENLADIIGIEITQQIINKYTAEGNGNSDFMLPALDFSTEQLLYISIAQMWCSTRSKEKEQLHFEEDVHAPSDVRIMGMLRNLPGFSNAFHCQLGSNMNPSHKCSISH